MNIAEILGISSVSDVNVTNQTENVENTNEDFASYLNASTTTMDDIFNKASETYNVPVALLKAMAKQESNFDPNATSSSGAQGVMQLMPATAASLGVTNAYDPEQNIMGGAKYISQLFRQIRWRHDISFSCLQCRHGKCCKIRWSSAF